MRLLERRDGEQALLVGGGLAGEPEGLSAPVARGRAQAVRARLLAGTTSLRRT